MTTTERNEAIDKAILILRQEMKEAGKEMLASDAPNIPFLETMDLEKNCIRSIQTLNRIKSKA